MDETQKLEDYLIEEEEEVAEENGTGRKREPLAKLRIFNNEHFPETGEWPAKDTSPSVVQFRDTSIPPVF